MSKNNSSLLHSYTGRTRIPAAHAGALGLLLEKSAPGGLTAAQKKKLDAVVAAGAEVEVARGMREASGVALAPLQRAMGAAFGAIDLMLEGLSLLPASAGDLGERATKLRAMIFPDGREFARATTVDACMTGRRVLARIEDRHLTRELSALIGPAPLAAAKTATSDLGEALGLGDKDVERTSPTVVADALEKFVTRLSAYARALAADVDEDDDASVQRFVDALAPIAQFRVLPRESGAADEEPSAPSPAAPQG